MDSFGRGRGAGIAAGAAVEGEVEVAVVARARRRRVGACYPLFLLLSLLLSACHHDLSSSDAHRPLELLVSSDAETLDPRYVTDAVGMRVTRLVHAGISRLDPVTLEPVPYLARSWRWLNEMTLEVTLRDDVRFHGGSLLSPKDVVATLRAFASPEVASRHASVVDAIATVEATGPEIVTITLRRPHATLLTDLELPILRADQAFLPPDPKGVLDGLGPYRVERVAQGEILLSPAEDAALPRPRRAVTVRTVHDENARALRLYAGRADIALNGISPTLLPAMAKAGGLAVASRPGANLTYVVVRMERGPLEDVRLRRAISMSIDRAEIASTLLGGHAQPAETLMPPGHWAYTPSPRGVDFDPGAARKALRDAGLAGVHLTLLTSTDRLRMSIARFVAQELGEVGVQVEVTPLELGTLLARLTAGDFEMATLQLPELTEPNVLRVFLHSAFVPPAGSNRGRVRDPELDAWLDRGDRVQGEDARRAVYAEIERRVREQLFIIPLWHEDQVVVTSARARAFVPSREGRWLSLASVP